MRVLTLLLWICNFLESLGSKSYIGSVLVIYFSYRVISWKNKYIILEVLMYCVLGFIGITLEIFRDQVFFLIENAYWKSFHIFSSSSLLNILYIALQNYFLISYSYINLCWLALVFNCTIIRMIEWLEWLNSVNGFFRIASELICD